MPRAGRPLAGLLPCCLAAVLQATARPPGFVAPSYPCRKFSTLLWSICLCWTPSTSPPHCSALPRHVAAAGCAPADGPRPSATLDGPPAAPAWLSARSSGQRLALAESAGPSPPFASRLQFLSSDDCTARSQGLKEAVLGSPVFKALAGEASARLTLVVCCFKIWWRLSLNSLIMSPVAPWEGACCSTQHHRQGVRCHVIATHRPNRQPGAVVAAQAVRPAARRPCPPADMMVRQCNGGLFNAQSTANAWWELGIGSRCLPRQPAPCTHLFSPDWWPAPSPDASLSCRPATVHLCPPLGCQAQVGGGQAARRRAPGQRGDGGCVGERAHCLPGRPLRLHQAERSGRELRLVRAGAALHAHPACSAQRSAGNERPPTCFGAPNSSTPGVCRPRPQVQLRPAGRRWLRALPGGAAAAVGSHPQAGAQL